MTTVKGSNVCFARTFANSRSARAGFEAVLAKLSLEDRTTIEAVIPSGWYELSLQHRVFVALDETFSDGGTDAIRDFARFTAEQDLTRIHRLFLRFRNPALVLEKAGEYWQRFYSAGTWKVERISDTHARGELSGIEEPHPVFCRFLTSYIERMFQLAGARRLSTPQHVRCVLEGAPACVFEGRWSEDATETSLPPARSNALSEPPR